MLGAEQVRGIIESSADEVCVRVESLGKPARDQTLKKASLSLLTPEFAAARKAEQIYAVSKAALEKIEESWENP